MRKTFGLPVSKAWLLPVIMLLFIAEAIAAGQAVWPAASGDTVKKDGDLTVDCSHMEDGYIMVKAGKAKGRLKVRVKCGDISLNYDVNGDGEYEVLPLQCGSGKYSIGLYKNISGKKYSQEGTVSLKVELSDENAAYLCPSQYVWYTEDSPAVAMSNELCAGLTTDKEKYDAIFSYIKSNFAYDYIKAVSVETGTLPDVDGTFENKSGICQDLSALMACMLRVQGIPTRMVIGYCNKNYHAWNEVLIDGEIIRADMTKEVGSIPDDAKYTTERVY